MSLEATVWALKKAPVPDPIAHLVLIGLADHAAADGTAAFPAAATLAEYARCSTRSVQRKLAVLEELGLIRRGDQSLVESIRADRRPVVWNLPIRQAHATTESHPVDGDATTDSRSVETNDTTGQVERYDTPVLDGTTAVSYKPSFNRTEPSTGATDVMEHFDRFWDAYGKKKDRGHAVRSWRAAMKKTKGDAEVIITAAIAFREAEKRVGTDDRFIPLPATWLNGERWTDERPDTSPSKSRLRDASTISRPPDGLTDAEYAAWHAEQRRLA